MDLQAHDNRSVTAFFDNRAHAESAVETLTNVGIPAASIRMVEGNDPAGASEASPQEEKGFFEAIGDFFMTNDDRETYAEGLRRGGYLVSVQTSDANYQRVIDILDTDGSVDMDERTETWRSEGWSGSATGVAAPVPAKPAEADDGEGTISVMEENLRVGKRDVSHGRVRVRAYTVEGEVSEDVTLRSETVSIDRRPVDRPIGDADAAFAERTIEVEESAEEAVVSKEARVKEEIDVNTAVEEETETVSGTVRHTEVEIEDDRKAKADPVR